MKWIAVIILIGLSFTWTVCQWNECRDNDLSMFYCLQHIRGGVPR